MGLSYNGANIFAYQYQDGAPLGLKGPNGDNYLYAHLQVDAQGSYRLPKGFKADRLWTESDERGLWVSITAAASGRCNVNITSSTIGAGVRWSSIERLIPRRRGI